MKNSLPEAYRIGNVPFGDCTILTDPRALIPRPETELLFERAKLKEGRVLDLCTGSGAIGVAVKKRYPHLDVTLSDLSHDALSLAKENALHNGVDVTILQGDLCTSLAEEKFDYVFCNPPYISHAVYQTLDLDPEPEMALNSGETGLEFYERLAKELPSHLKPGAKVFLEIGYDQKNSLLQIFSGPEWHSVACEKDWSGHDRFIDLESKKV
jgi:release factor glutamine methyltransferase